MLQLVLDVTYTPKAPRTSKRILGWWPNTMLRLQGKPPENVVLLTIKTNTRGQLHTWPLHAVFTGAERMQWSEIEFLLLSFILILHTLSVSLKWCPLYYGCSVKHPLKTSGKHYIGWHGLFKDRDTITHKLSLLRERVWLRESATGRRERKRR